MSKFILYALLLGFCSKGKTHAMDHRVDEGSLASADVVRKSHIISSSGRDNMTLGLEPSTGWPQGSIKLLLQDGYFL